VLALLLAPALRAAEPNIGKATSVIPAASYARGSKVAALEINDPIEQNDRVTTSGKGSTQIRFVDSTVLTIGPNSEILLDKMVFDGERARNVTVRLVHGAMRFASGLSDHRSYHLETTVAVIGVRGTVVDLSYENRKTIYRTVEGDAEVCTINNLVCRDVRAGDPPIAVTLQGIVLATAAEAARLFRVLDTVTTALTDQAKGVLKVTTDVVEPPLNGVGQAVQKVDDTVQKFGKGVVKGVQRLLPGPRPNETPPESAPR
jgi:hypothetical protein